MKRSKFPSANQPSKKIALFVLSMFCILVLGLLMYSWISHTKVYKNAAYRFSFHYPANYTIREEPYNGGISITLENSQHNIAIRAEKENNGFMQFRVKRANEIRIGNTLWKYDPPNEFCDGPGCAQLAGQYGKKNDDIYYMIDALDEEKAKRDLELILTTFSYNE